MAVEYLKQFAFGLKQENDALTKIAGGMLGIPFAQPMQPPSVGNTTTQTPAPQMPQSGAVPPNPPQANMVTQPVPAQPLPQGVQPAEQYDVATLRPIDTGPIPAPTGAPGVIFDVLVNEGNVPSHVAYATLGNLQQESGFNPASWNKNEGAFGIAQWRDDRLENLKNYAENTGQDFRDLRTQARFILHEGRTTEKDAWNRVMSAPDVDTASDLFDQHYERSAGTERGVRREYAQAFAGGKPMGLNEAWVSTSGYNGGPTDPSFFPTDRETEDEEPLGWRDRLIGRAPTSDTDTSAAARVRRQRQAQLQAIGVGLGQISHGQPVDVTNVLENHYQRTQEIAQRAKEIRLKQQAQRERSATIAAMPSQYQQLATTGDEGYALAVDLYKQDQKGGENSNAPLTVDPTILDDMNKTDPRYARMYASGVRAAQDIALARYGNTVEDFTTNDGKGGGVGGSGYTQAQLDSLAASVPEALATTRLAITMGDSDAIKDAIAYDKDAAMAALNEGLGRETTRINENISETKAQAHRDAVAEVLRGSGHPDLAAQASAAASNDDVAQAAYAEYIKRTGQKFSDAEDAAEFVRQRDAFVNTVSADPELQSLGVGIVSPEALTQAMEEYYNTTGKRYDAAQESKKIVAEREMNQDALNRGRQTLVDTGNGNLVGMIANLPPTASGVEQMNAVLTKIGESAITVNEKDVIAKAEAQRRNEDYTAAYGDLIPNIGDVAAVSQDAADTLIEKHREQGQKNANLDEFIQSTSLSTSPQMQKIHEAAKLARASNGTMTMTEAMETLYPEAPTSVQELEAFDSWDADKQQRWLSMQKSGASGGDMTDQIKLRQWDSADARIQRYRKAMDEQQLSGQAMQNMQDLFEQNDWKLPTGTVQNWLYPARRLADSLGMLPSDESQSVSMQTAIQQFKKAAIGSVREPGATSEKELDTYMKGLPGIESSPAANRLTLQVGLANRALQEDKASSMEEYLAEKGNLNGFDNYYQDRINSGLTPQGIITPENDTAEVLMNRINSGNLQEGMMMKFMDDTGQPVLRAATAFDIEAMRQVAEEELYGGPQ